LHGLILGGILVPHDQKRINPMKLHDPRYPEATPKTNGIEFICWSILGGGIIFYLDVFISRWLYVVPVN